MLQAEGYNRFFVGSGRSTTLGKKLFWLFQTQTSNKKTANA